MLIIPAVDLKDGACVQLQHNNTDNTSIISDDPVAAVTKLVEADCKRVHLVDLNGAFEGKPVNAPIIEAIAHKFPDLPLQVGGGIRTLETIDQYLMAGVNYVIIGTRAVKEPDFIKNACQHFPDKIIVAIDAKDGLVTSDGWTETSSISAKEMVKQFEDYGVTSIIYRDINQEKNQQFNVDKAIMLATATSLPIILSGGIHTIEDIESILKTNQSNITGVITGHAIYNETLDLAEAQTLCDRYKPNT